jgi:hypothetical protein
MELGMYIVAPEPTSTAYFINPSHQSVCLYVHPSIVTRQRLGKHVTAAKNTLLVSGSLRHATNFGGKGAQDMRSDL